MIDKIMKVNNNKAVIIFTDREPLTIESDSGYAVYIANILMNSEYTSMQSLCEDSFNRIEFYALAKEKE